MADSLYLAELLFVVILVACAWPLYVLQLITLRFTPRRKLVPVKTVLLAGGFLVVVAMTLRTPDPSSVYGRLSTHFNLIVEAQCTSFLLYCTSSYLVASAKSLFMQIQQPPPRFLAPALYGSVLFFQLLYTAVLVAQSQMLERDYPAWSIMRLWILLDLLLDVEIAFMLVCGWFLYKGLRTKLKAFIVTLKEQEAKKASATRMTIFQVITAAASAARERNVSNGATGAEAALVPHSGPNSNNNAVSPAGTLPPPSLPPTPTHKPLDLPPASPSHHGLTATAATAHATPSFRAVAQQQEVELIGTMRSQHLPPMAPQAPSAIRQLNPLMVRVASAEDNIARPVPVQLGGQQQQQGGEEQLQPVPPSPSAATAAAAAAAVVSARGETVVTITAPPPSSAPPSASASSAAAPLMRTPTNANSVAPSPSSVLSSASADRLAELTAALTKITRMTCLISLIGVLAIASVWPRLDDTLRGRINRRDVYGQDPDLYSPVRIIPIALPLALALVFVWYVWSKPYWLYAQLRRDRHTPFWPTLLHGLSEHNSARYLKHGAQQTTPQHTVVGYGASPLAAHGTNAAQNSLVKPMGDTTDNVSVLSHHAVTAAGNGAGTATAEGGSPFGRSPATAARRAVQSKFLRLATAERKRCASIVDPAAVAAAQVAAPKPETPFAGARAGFGAGAGDHPPSSPQGRRPSQAAPLPGSGSAGASPVASPGASPSPVTSSPASGQATAVDDPTRPPVSKAAW